MKISALVMALLLIGLSAGAGEYRNFMSADGKTIRGKVVAFDENLNRVTIERDNKKQATVPITVFSAEDQDYLRHWKDNQDALQEKKEQIVSWDKFHRNFQWGLHCTLHTQPGKVSWDPTMHYTGPDSPFVKYVRDMRTCGFSGMLLQLRQPGAYIAEQDEQGKWRIPEEKMKLIREAVDVATEAGYWLVLEVNPIKYEDLRDTRKHIKLEPEERYTDDWIQKDFDIWEQVIHEFKAYRNIGYRTNNEFHGYKWEQTLPGNHPKSLNKTEAHEKFMDYMIRKGELARAIKPDAWLFYRNQGQMIMGAKEWDFPFGDDPPLSPAPCYAGFAMNFNNGEHGWGYYGLDHSEYTEEYMKWIRLNRKAPPHKEAAGLLREYRESRWQNMGAMINRFGLNYHSSRPDCKKVLTDYQDLAQMAFLYDYFNEDKSITTYLDGDTSGGMKANGIFNTVKNEMHAHNVPCLDQFFDLTLQKSYSRKLKLESSEGGEIKHSLPPKHRGVHMVRIGDKITLEATPEAGYVFAGWSGSVTGKTNPLTLEVPDNHGAIRANFAKPNQNPPKANVFIVKRHWEAHEPVDYTYVDQARPDSHFANVEKPLYRPTNTKENKNNAKNVYLKFKVDKLPSDRNSIAYATIKFRNLPHGEGNTSTPKADISVHAVDSNWHRKNVTWNKRPKIQGSDPLYIRTCDPWLHQEQIHLEITDYIKTAAKGSHAFCISASQDRDFDHDMEITAYRKPDTIKTYDKPLLYVVWDEKVPPPKWE